jgi:hypothetical protein
MVDVVATLPLTIEVSGADEVGDNALGRTLSDVQQGSYISDADARITSNDEEGIAVVRQHLPR